MKDILCRVIFMHRKKAKNKEETREKTTEEREGRGTE